MTNVGGVASEQLKQFIEHIERLEEEKSAIAEHTREVYAEAKTNGYDTKIIRKVVTLRKKRSPRTLRRAGTSGFISSCLRHDSEV